MVICHRDREQDVDTEASRRLAETIDKRVVCLRVGTHEELPLRAPTRDHVGPAREHFARERHALFSAFSRSSVVKSTSVRFLAARVTGGATSVRYVGSFADGDGTRQRLEQV